MSYIYGRENIIQEFQIIHKNQRRYSQKINYIHGPGIDEPLARVESEYPFFYHADSLGSIVSITDRYGKILQRYQYSVFGIPKRTGTMIRSSYAFTGREWDRETGLYYYRSRYYDPLVGRFISKDPIGFAGGEINLYNYVKNNPINARDPDGCNPFFMILGIKVIAIGTSYAGTKIAQWTLEYLSKQYISNAGINNSFKKIIKGYTRITPFFAGAGIALQTGDPSLGATAAWAIESFIKAFIGEPISDPKFGIEFINPPCVE